MFEFYKLGGCQPATSPVVHLFTKENNRPIEILSTILSNKLRKPLLEHFKGHLGKDQGQRGAIASLVLGVIYSNLKNASKYCVDNFTNLKEQKLC